MNPFTAHWSAQGNNLCLGHWEIFHQAQLLELDEVRRVEDLGTHGIYSYIFPDDEDYAEGYHEDEWIEKNKEWLTPLFTKYQIPADEAHMRWFYQAVNPQDWRCGSCGGCL